MRRSRTLILIVSGLALAVAAATVRAQLCQADCDRALERCKEACVDAQGFDDCLSDCRTAYQQCLASCE
jgi:hypothetical protein